MKGTNHSLKEDWILKSGSIIFATFLTLMFFNLNAQVNINEEAISLDTVSGDLLLIYVKECPGEISGECIKSLFLLSNNVHRPKDFKKGEYQLQDDEIYVIFDPLYVKKLLSNIEFADKNVLNELLKFYTVEKNLWKYDLEDFETTKKGKVKLKVLTDVKNKALIIKTNSPFVNKVYNNRINVKSNNEKIKVAILFDNKSLLEIERIMNFKE